MCSGTITRFLFISNIVCSIYSQTALLLAYSSYISIRKPIYGGGKGGGVLVWWGLYWGLKKLIKAYNYPGKKIEIIPHGVPDIPLEPNDKYKKKKRLEDRLIIGNINLLSEIKGLEYTLEALRDIKRQFSNVLYLIIGQ